jgi:hypothetical protein
VALAQFPAAGTLAQQQPTQVTEPESSSSW